jgi:taurine--2-oxoglutarate transaminase
VREICDEYGVLLIADEVMTGFGRTGRWFAVEHWGVEPDIMTVSKGLTSGTVPLGAVVVTDEIAHHFEDNPLWAGLTYGAHTLACAAALATIQAYRDEGIPERVVEMGELLKDEYADMSARHPSIGEARSLGLFSALELVRSRETREPLVPQIDPAFENYGVMKEMFAFMLQRGVVTMTRWNWLMVNPPLTITPEELREGLAVVDEALDLADQAMV